MTNMWKARVWLSTLVTTILISLSYEVKTFQDQTNKYVIILLSIVLSNYLAATITTILISTRFGRMSIFRRSWVEGYWYLHTYVDETSAHPISNDGLVNIFYTGSGLELFVTTYRRGTGSIKTAFSSVSELVALREFDDMFTNYFVIPEGKGESRGITVGKFFSQNSSVFPTRFEGTVVLFSDGLYRRQTAQKIPFSVVRSLQREHGDNWRDFVLENGVDTINQTACKVRAGK
ncbi:MAG: hypothetical protein ACLQF2_15175 [Rhodomicrobium sp.]